MNLTLLFDYPAPIGLTIILTSRIPRIHRILTADFHHPRPGSLLHFDSRQLNPSHLIPKTGDSVASVAPRDFALRLAEQLSLTLLRTLSTQPLDLPLLPEKTLFYVISAVSAISFKFLAKVLCDARHGNPDRGDLTL